MCRLESLHHNSDPCRWKFRRPLPRFPYPGAKVNTRRGFLGRAISVGATALAAPAFASNESASVPNDRWQLGCFTRPWAEFDYRSAFDDIAAAGFRHVGLMRTKNEAGDRKSVG